MLQRLQTPRARLQVDRNRPELARNRQVLAEVGPAAASFGPMAVEVEPTHGELAEIERSTDLDELLARLDGTADTPHARLAARRRRRTEEALRAMTATATNSTTAANGSTPKVGTAATAPRPPTGATGPGAAKSGHRCEQCGTPFTPTKRGGLAQRFCSVDCRHTAELDRRRGARGAARVAANGSGRKRAKPSTPAPSTSGPAPTATSSTGPEAVEPSTGPAVMDAPPAGPSGPTAAGVAELAVELLGRGAEIELVAPDGWRLVARL